MPNYIYRPWWCFVCDNLNMGLLFPRCHVFKTIYFMFVCLHVPGYLQSAISEPNNGAWNGNLTGLKEWVWRWFESKIFLELSVTKSIHKFNPLKCMMCPDDRAEAREQQISTVHWSLTRLTGNISAQLSDEVRCRID